MKKILFLSLACAVVVSGLFFFFNGQKKNAVAPAAFISEDVLAFFTQKDMGRLVDNVKKSRLGKTFGHIDLVKIADDMGFPQENILLFQKVLGEADDFLASPLFKEIFNNECTLALFPVINPDSENAAGKIEEHLLLIARPEHGAQLINLLSSGFSKVLNQSNVSYGTYSIKIFHLEEGKNLAAIAVHDLVLVSFNEQIIQDSLDRYDKKKRSLGDNESYLRLRAMFNDPVSFGYLGIESLRQQMEMFVKRTDLTQKDLLKNAWRKWNGLQAAGYGVWRENDRIRDKGVFVVDNAQLDPALRNFYATPAEKNFSLAIVPRNVLAYYWTNTMDFPAYWKMYLQESGFSRQKIDAIREGGKRQLGMEVESILDLLGHQCGLMVQEGAGKRLLPLPDFSIYVSLKDSAGVNELVQRFLNNNAVQIQKQDYKGVEIIALSGPPRDVLMPVVAINGTYLVVASNMMMLKQIIDTMKEGHGLADNPHFQQVSAGLLDDNNSVGYVRIGELMHVVKGIIGWGRTIIALQDKANARKTEIVIDRLVNPLLDGLSMYSDFGLRSRITPSQVLIESTTLIEK